MGNKELLIIDLSTRLPYGVIVTDNRHGNSVITEIDTISGTVYCSDFDEYVPIEKCKPYLRPMFSMTDEERNEYTSLCNRQDIDTPTWSKIIWHDTYKSIDWLNKKNV